VPFDEFAKEVEKYIREPIDEKVKSDWKFTGLNNKDFFMMVMK
jgi:hypothetical protein